MKKLAIIAFLFAASAASAQSTTSNSQSQSGASVNSVNEAYSGAQIINYGSDRLTYGGSYEVKNVPSVSAPGIVVSNQCALGVSAGVAAVGGGISFGGSKLDKNCVILAQAAAINALAGADAALHHLAQVPSICNTLRATGRIAAGSVCPGEKLAKPAKASGPADAGFSKCAKDGNAVRIRYKPGADKSAAKAACLAQLGY